MNNKETGPAITGIGVGIPERALTNREIAKGVNTTDRWIRQNVGIKERRIANGTEATSDFAYTAAIEALKMAELDPRRIDEIIVATATPDFLFPATACIVQGKLGADNAAAYDLAAACSGSIYGLKNAYDAHKAGSAENSLVIGAETLSRIIDWNDRATCVLFGDGAGAVVVQNVEEPGIAKFVLKADGTQGSLLMLPAGGSRFPASRETVDVGMHFIKMEGHEVFKHAVRRMEEVAAEVLSKAGFTDAHGNLDIDQVDLVIPHQANQRIMDAVWKRLGVPKKKRFSNIERYGNTSAASIYIAMYEAYQQGRLNKDDILLLVVFGSGFTYAAAVLQCHLEPIKRGLREKLAQKLHHPQT